VASGAGWCRQLPVRGGCGTHGGVSSRREKEELFAKAVLLIDPYARRALDEINQGLLLGTGEATGTGVKPQAAGGIEAEWTLTWPLQQAAGIARAGNLARPLRHRVPSPAPAQRQHRRLAAQRVRRGTGSAELPTLRAMAAADLHNLVFQLGGDVRIIPAVQAQTALSQLPCGEAPADSESMPGWSGVFCHECRTASFDRHWYQQRFKRRRGRSPGIED
jgi:hypothetical protein